MQSFLKDELFYSKNKLSEYELGINERRKYKTQERIDKRRQNCKKRLKNDPEYKLEVYMFAIGSCSVKSDFGIRRQQINVIENSSLYQTICIPPSAAKRRKSISKRINRNSELNIPTDSESEPDMSCILPDPITPGLKKNKQKGEKERCPQCKKGFNIRSITQSCSSCAKKFHTKCVSWKYDEEYFLCMEHVQEEVVLDLNLDVIVSGNLVNWKLYHD